MKVHSFMAFVSVVLHALFRVTMAKGIALGPSGFLQTATDVTEQADLALDIREMSALVTTDRFELAKQVYYEGLNSEIHDKSGVLPGKKRPLRWASTNAGDVFKKNPTYLFQLYGLSQGNPDDISDDIRFYADTFVGRLLQDRIRFAAEAAKVLNLWMFAVHRVWETMRSCWPDLYPSTEFKNAISMLDQSMAFWIGSGFGDNNFDEGNPDGHALYNLAQETGAKFGTNGKSEEFAETTGEGLANVNSNIKALFEEANLLITTENVCGVFDLTTSTDLYKILNGLVGQMTVPLLQGLIGSMHDPATPPYVVRMYALAIVPQLSVCHPSSHAFLQKSLIFDDFKEENFSSLLAALQSTYECLGITCADVGTFMKGRVPQCADVPDNLPLAGFSPDTPVKQHAKIDLDILQIKALTKLKAYHLAGFIYANGRNSHIAKQYISLKALATSENRKLVDPFYGAFQTYYQDDNYADALIESVLYGEGKWEEASTSQRSWMIVKTIQNQIMYMAALTQLHTALGACYAGENPTTEDNMVANITMASSFDRAVAYMTGSLEGHYEGGSFQNHDGMLLYGLANKRCEQFGRCAPGHPAHILEAYQNFFYSAKDSIQVMNCHKVC